jgi:ABC-type multidrug transport system fused ATPase/permease subunit
VQSARIEAIKLRSLFEAALDFVPNLTNICLIIGGAFRVRSGDLTVGELASFIYMFTLLVFPLRLIGYALSEMPRSQAGFGRIQQLRHSQIVADPSKMSHHAGQSLVISSLSIGHDIDHPLTHNFSASFEPSSFNAIVGYTGCGKSTLLQTIAGTIPPLQGSILIPDSSVCLVFQEPFLFGTSVRDNMCMGLKFSDLDLSWALKVAEADFVFQLPQGIDTVIGERGVGLSGGQRQRIALARAIVRRPHVLLLDDTTSALDPNTEINVLNNIRTELSNTIVIAVASRPSLIGMAETVMFFDVDEIHGPTSHIELLIQSNQYRLLMQAYEKPQSASDVQVEGVQG